MTRCEARPRWPEPTTGRTPIMPEAAPFAAAAVVRDFPPGRRRWLRPQLRVRANDTNAAEGGVTDASCSSSVRRAMPDAGGARAGGAAAPARRASDASSRCRREARTGCTWSMKRSSTRSTRACTCSTAIATAGSVRSMRASIRASNLSPDGGTTVVGTTYFCARQPRRRAPTWSSSPTTRTLGLTREIVLPSKRARPLPTYFNVAYSADGHFLYVSYVTPAASFGVLDPAHKAVLGEIDTAGCVLVIPSGPNRVSSICESGRLLTVTLDAQGHEASRAHVRAVLRCRQGSGVRAGRPDDRGLRCSYPSSARCTKSTFSGAQPAFRQPWSTRERRGEGPAGGRAAQQVGAISPRARAAVRADAPRRRRHAQGRRHRDLGVRHEDPPAPGALAACSRTSSAPVVAVQVSQDDAPILFAATDNADVAVFDALTGELRHVEKQLGQTPWMLSESLKAPTMRSIDRLFEHSSRSLAQRTSRRSVLATLGQLLTGAALLPLLPIDRSSRRSGRGRRGARARPSAPAATRSGELRVLEVLRDRRIPVLLLRRHLALLPARHRALADHLDRHLPQPGRRPRLHRLLQRLLR